MEKKYYHNEDMYEYPTYDSNITNTYSKVDHTDYILINIIFGFLLFIIFIKCILYLYQPPLSIQRLSTEHSDSSSTNLLKYNYVEKYNDDSCSICLEVFINKEQLVILKCNHLYHEECIKKWNQIKNICPLCNL